MILLITSSLVKIQLATIFKNNNKTLMSHLMVKKKKMMDLLIKRMKMNYYTLRRCREDMKKLKSY